MDKKKIMNKMTLEEKVMLLQARDNWSLNGVERLGIPSIVLTDGPNGVRLTASSTEVFKATAVPTESILSSSWNTDLVKRIGNMLGKESQNYHIGVLLGPGINAKRSPLAGRNFEYYSEDPYLSGKLAAALITGIQEEGVGSSLKHFVANDQETRRFTADVTVDERELQEILLKPFEIAIREGKPWTIMSAYPRLRGEYLSQNAYILKDILRDSYQYEGVVLSDWGAVIDKVTSHKNGLDLETGSFVRQGEMLAALESGELSEKELDEHVLRVLTLLEKVIEGQKDVSIDWDVHHELVREAARECIVLLKNQENILPLAEGAQVAVIGKFAKEPRIMGGGSSCTNPQQLDTAYQFISQYANAAYAPGYENETVDAELIEEACQIAKGKDFVIVFVGTTEVTESEGLDRMNMLLPESHIELIRAIAKKNPNIIVVNSSGAAVELRQIETEARAIVHTGLAGEGGGCAVADILFGKVNPSGKLSETFPICLEHTPTYPDFPGYNDDVVYHEGLMVGYRYYDTKKIPVQYPFGFGLSYTQFAYSNLRLSAEGIKNGQTVKVMVDVTNTGDVFGKEVVQLYVADPVSYLIRPEKELKAFAKVALAPGETRTVTMELDERAFAYYVPHLNRFAVESGDFTILVGASSQDVRLSANIHFTSSDDVRLPLTLTNTVAEFYNDSRYHNVAAQALGAVQITEDSFVFPIIAGMLLKSLSDVLSRHFGVPKEMADMLQQAILNNQPIEL